LFHRWPLLGFEYDVLHAHFGYNAIIAAELKAAELISGPLVTTFHGVDLNVYPNKHPKGVYQKVFSQSDALIVGSMFGRKRLLELGAPAERIKVMPTGIDLETFPFSERHRCQSKPVCVLTVSRLVEVKGIRYGIEAIARLQEQGVNVQYWIVGDGPLREELEALTRDLGVTESVIFFGAQTQEELKRIYTEAHLFLLPGIHAPDGAVETQGLVLAEAQATGLPVVASDCGGISESLREGHSGVLVPERDVERLASELARLVEQSSRWPEMGRYGRDFVTKKFDLQHHVDSLESLYEAL
jgi:colanic acid/amylovoran biosynthesis glycosyltransferase